MNAIDWLVSVGRDPLEVVWIPLPDDLEQRVKNDKDNQLDGWIVRELTTWPVDVQKRLLKLIDNRVEKLVREERQP